MAINLHLQNLAPLATNLDIRRFFRDFEIPVGGVQIIGGKNGEAFIAFATPDDLLGALALDRQPILGQPVKLLLANRTDMDRVIGRLGNNLEKGHPRDDSDDPKDIGGQKTSYSHTPSAIYNDELRGHKVSEDQFRSQDHKDEDSEKPTTDLAIRSRQYEADLRRRLEQASLSTKLDSRSCSTVDKTVSYSQKYADDMSNPRIISEGHAEASFKDEKPPRITSSKTVFEYDHHVKRRRISDTSTSNDPGFIQACNIPLAATAQDLRKIFSGHAIATDGIIMKISDQNPDSLDAFVKFVNMKDAIKADCICDGFKLHGNSISVSLITEDVFEYQHTAERSQQESYQQDPLSKQSHMRQYQPYHGTPKHLSRLSLPSSASNSEYKEDANTHSTSRNNGKRSKHLRLHRHTLEDMSFLRWDNPTVDCLGPNKVWSVFGGRNGRSSGVILVYGESSKVVIAFVAFENRTQRNLAEAKYAHTGIRQTSSSSVLRHLQKLIKDGRELYVSSETGMDRIACAEEKAQLMPHGGKRIRHEVEQKHDHIHSELKNAPSPKKVRISDRSDQQEQSMPSSSNDGEKGNAIGTMKDKDKVIVQKTANFAVKKDNDAMVTEQEPASTDGKTENAVTTGDQEKVLIETDGRNGNDTISNDHKEQDDQKPLLNEGLTEQSTASDQEQDGQNGNDSVQGKPNDQESNFSSQNGNEVTTIGQDELNDCVATNISRHEGSETTLCVQDKSSNEEPMVRDGWTGNNATASDQHKLSNQKPPDNDGQKSINNVASTPRELSNQAPLSSDGEMANYGMLSGVCEPSSSEPTYSDAKKDSREPINQEPTGNDEQQDMIKTNDQIEIMNKELTSRDSKNVNDTTANTQCEAGDQEPTDSGGQKEQIAPASEAKEQNGKEPKNIDQAKQACNSDQQSETNRTCPKVANDYNKISEENTSCQSMSDKPFGIFDPDIITTMSYIRIFDVETAFPGVMSASALWGVFGGATGRCQGVISYQPKNSHKKVGDAILGYMSETQCQKAFKNEVRTGYVKKAHCMSKTNGASTLRLLSTIASSTDRMYASSKSGQDIEITKEERRILQSKNKHAMSSKYGHDSACSSQSRHSERKSKVNPKHQADTKSIPHKQKQSKEESPCLFDPEVIKKLSFIRINKPTPGKCATDLWVMCGDSNGKCLGVVTVQDISGKTVVAFLAYDTAVECNLVITGPKNIEGKWSKCSGPAVVSYLASFLHKDHLLSASTKKLEDREITLREGRNLQATMKERSKDMSTHLGKIPDKIPSKNRKVVEARTREDRSKGRRQGNFRGLYTYVRLVNLEANVTACDIWSWFNGEKGPCTGVTLVSNKKGRPLFAYVSIKGTHTRCLERFNKKHYTTVSFAKRRHELASLDSTYKIVESTRSGKDRVIQNELLSGEEDLLIAELIDVPDVSTSKDKMNHPLGAASDPRENVGGMSGAVSEGSDIVDCASGDENSLSGDEGFIVVDEFVADSDIDLPPEDQCSNAEAEDLSVVGTTSAELDQTHATTDKVFHSSGDDSNTHRRGDEESTPSIVPELAKLDERVMPEDKSSGTEIQTAMADTTSDTDNMKNSLEVDTETIEFEVIGSLPEEDIDEDTVPRV